MPRLWDASKVVLWWGPALCLLQPMYHLCFMRVSRDIEVKWVVQDWKWNLWNLMLFLLLLFSYWDMSDSLWPSELQHARLPCPLLSPWVCPNLFIDSMMTSSHLILYRPPSPPTLNLSQHQGLFQWVSSWQQVAKVLEFQLQHQSFQWIFRIDFL